jgi:hypothetical protein
VREGGFGGERPRLIEGEVRPPSGVEEQPDDGERFGDGLTARQPPVQRLGEVPCGELGELGLVAAGRRAGAGQRLRGAVVAEAASRAGVVGEQSGGPLALGQVGSPGRATCQRPDIASPDRA